MKSFGLSLTALLLAGSCLADDAVMPSVAERFSDPAQTESVPDFQRHIVPLMGKLGCNGRACHGSFQGRGGFRLSLFGYDFKADHDELFGRLDPETPSQSLILQKPLMEDPHEGGQRLKHNSWEHNLLLAWIKDQAPGRPENAAKLTVLEVTPAEIRFSKDSDSVQLKAVAVWSDGTREDVTTLCRFQSNDDQVADITEDGFVKAGTSGDTHVVAFYDSAVVPVPVIRPVSDKTGDRYPKTPTPTEVDRLVIDKLAKLGVVQSDVCTDEEFLRRVSLDVTGALPGVREIQEFVADQSSDKRSRKIDELLERPGYVAWWTTRLCDFTGNSDEQLNNVTPIRSEASKQWYDWIYKRVATNVHYDDIVEGMVMAVSRDPGESYQDYCKNISELYHRDSKSDFGDREFMPHYWSRRNFQTTEDRVIGFAYTFLGLRIQCAQCHKHPFDQWTQEDFKGFEKFFTGTVGRNQAPRPEDRDEYNRMLKAIEGTSDLKGNQLRNELGKKLREGQIVPFGEVYTQAPPKIEVVERKGKKEKVRKGNSRTATEGRLLGQETMDLTQYEDIRQPLMAWMRSPDNPLFARAFVNRVWASYFNVGIVNPSDDLNLANPPSNAPLLDYLAQQFIAHDFDMKWLHRTILNSRTYQLSWIPNETNQHDERNFARAVPRRLPAETAWDILTQAVSNDDTFVALTTDIEDRAVAIPGSGGRNQNRNADYALTIFGRSTRESNCDCDRSEEPSLLQTIFLRNDGQVLSMIDQKDGWLAQVASENGLKFQSKSPAGEDRAAKAKADQLKKTYQNRLAEQENALRKARKKGEDPKRIARLEAQLEASRERWKSYLNPEAGAANEAATKTATLDLPKIIDQAYLRTLSRLPSEQERTAAEAYVAEAGNQLDGLRGVLWALVNTKEFIVNH